MQALGRKSILGQAKNPGPHIPCGCLWDELMLQLHVAAGLCPASGLGWAGLEDSSELFPDGD